MNYQKIYDQIIERARNRKLDGYRERHHILPRSMGGDDSPENLVELTAREHFICHWLLTKIYSKGKMSHKAILAFAMMAWCSDSNQERLKANSRLYERLKSEHSRIMSRNQRGEKNSQYGTCWINRNGEAKKIRKDDFPSFESEGWALGRTKPKNLNCEVCGVDTGTPTRRFCDAHRPRGVPLTKRRRQRTEEQNEKLRQYCLSRSREEHPQYGKRWVNNGEENRMVPKDSVNSYLSRGWVRGKIKRISS